MMKLLFAAACFCLFKVAPAQPGKGAGKKALYRDYKSITVPSFVVDIFANIDDDDASKLNAINIKEFNDAMPAGERVIANATVVGDEDTARGTNVAPAIKAALKAAMKGQFVIIGPGEWVVSTPIEIPASKQVNVICIGNLHFNKRDGFRITAPSGADPQHHLFFYGTLIGRENMPRHTKAAHDAGTQPQWAEMSNTAIDITNCAKNYILLNKAEGFGNAVRINGEKGMGSQENTVSFQYLNKNANGITLRSVDGNSYVDKNKFIGLYGGAGRISGGLAINIDGCEGRARNGERYNGAFRSNEFHFIVEHVDSIMVANGDITEPVFDITIEAGENTGVFGVPFQIRSVEPNYMRSPKFCGAGIFNTKWLTNGLGRNGVIMGVPVYYNARTLVGTDGKIDDNGNIVMEVRTPLPKKIKDGLPKNIKTVMSR
jgi:hypothetical protein